MWQSLQTHHSVWTVRVKTSYWLTGINCATQTQHLVFKLRWSRSGLDIKNRTAVRVRLGSGRFRPEIGSLSCTVRQDANLQAVVSFLYQVSCQTAKPFALSADSLLLTCRTLCFEATCLCVTSVCKSLGAGSHYKENVQDKWGFNPGFSSPHKWFCSRRGSPWCYFGMPHAQPVLAFWCQLDLYH